MDQGLMEYREEQERAWLLKELLIELWEVPLRCHTMSDPYERDGGHFLKSVLLGFVFSQWHLLWS